MAALRKLQSFPLRVSSSTCRHFSVNNVLNGNTESHRFVVAGGGAGGLAVASYLARKYPNQVAIVEPADVCTLLLYFFCYHFLCYVYFVKL